MATQRQQVIEASQRPWQRWWSIGGALSGFFIGAIFALDLLGVPEEPALVMVLVVQFSSLLAVASIGAFALWRSGIALDELRLAKGSAVESS